VDVFWDTLYNDNSNHYKETLHVYVMTAASVGVEKPLPGDCEKTGGSMCQADDRCLSNSSVCDGVIDCSDASDELNCYGLYP